MKPFASIFISILFVVVVVLNLGHQADKTIWLSTDAANYKTGETVIVYVHAASEIPIQGFSFQVSYDPLCLSPRSASTQVEGMSGVLHPQPLGSADVQFSSTSDHLVNGTLTEIRFVAIGACSTHITLENVKLHAYDQAGNVVALAGVSFKENSISLRVNEERVFTPTEEMYTGAYISLQPTDPPLQPRQIPAWLLGIFSFLALIIVGLVTMNLMRASTLS